MATLAELQAKREELIAARGNPEQRIKFKNGENEEEVWYRADTELSAALRDIERRIAIASGTKINTIRITTSKGV